MAWTAQPRYDASRNQWILRFKTIITEPDGSQKTKSRHYLGTDRADAFRRAAEIMRDRPADAEDDSPPFTVGAAIDKWLARRPSDWRDQMLRTWFDFAGHSSLAEMTDTHLEDYHDYLVTTGYKRQRRVGTTPDGQPIHEDQRRDFTPQTIRHKVGQARQVLRWCKRKGWLATVPETPEMDRPAENPQHYDPAQLAAVWTNLAPTTKRILSFIVETGCRLSEAIGLRWHHVKLDRGAFGECRLPAVEHKTGKKTGDTRVIVLTAAARLVLQEIGPKKRGSVFLSARGKPYSGPGPLYRTLRRHGLDRLYWLRHTRAQSMFDGGADLADVAKWLGHKDLRMAQRYVKVRTERLHEVASTLSSPLSTPTDGEPPPIAESSSDTASAPTPDQGGRPKRGRSRKARRRRSG